MIVCHKGFRKFTLLTFGNILKHQSLFTIALFLYSWCYNFIPVSYFESWKTKKSNIRKKPFIQPIEIPNRPVPKKTKNYLRL